MFHVQFKLNTVSQQDRNDIASTVEYALKSGGYILNSEIKISTIICNKLDYDENYDYSVDVKFDKESSYIHKDSNWGAIIQEADVYLQTQMRKVAVIDFPNGHIE